MTISCKSIPSVINVEDEDDDAEEEEEKEDDAEEEEDCKEFVLLKSIDRGVATGYGIAAAVFGWKYASKLFRT